jgi:hypothetical protein
MKPLVTIALAVAQIAAGQQALDEELIGAVAGAGEERPADQSRPERERHRDVRGEREHLQLPGVPPCRDDGAPPAGHEVDDLVGRQQRSADVDHELDQIRPDDRRDPAFERVDERQHADDGDRPEPQVRETGKARLQHRGQHERRGEDADALGERAHDQEQPGGNSARDRTEAALEQRVGREQLAAEIRRQQQAGDDEAANDIADEDLQVRERSSLLRAREMTVGERGHADQRQRARLSGDDREADDDPGRLARTEEVILDAPVSLAEPHAERGDAGEVREQHDVIDRRESHRPLKVS